NALMLRAWIDAYKAFGEENFLEKALLNAEFLLENAITDEGEIFRNCMKDKHAINGFLDDYTFSISAFIVLYQVTFDEKWLMLANKLMQYVDEHFGDENDVMYYFSNNKYDQLAVRTKETHDNVIPASNSEMAKNLLMLSSYLNNDSYLKKAKNMVLSLKNQLVKNPYFNTNWAIVALLTMEQPFEIAIVGDNFKKLLREMQSKYLPTSLFMGGTNGGSLDLLMGKYEKGKTQVFVCKNKTCQLPVDNASEALQLVL
ncbi:MAG: hypothetical protein MI922_04445, partial [Bacteroidales bacterium]|nr:hypothetical protein [Bacteroidales bacterium]